MNWFWLSFADGTLPAGSQFLGVAIVGPAAHIGQAVQLAQLLEINPGGEVQGVEIPDWALARIPEDKRDRLLTKADAVELDRLMSAPQVGG